jgi:hypothetical protein
VNVFEPRANPKHGEWLPMETPGEFSWRRTIYLMRMRGADDGVFKPFDVPDCGQVRAKRGVSTTPLQALNLFNSPFVLEQAARLAARAEREAGADRGRQIERAFELTLARSPTPVEQAACREIVQAHGLPAVCRSLLNSNEFLFIE